MAFRGRYEKERLEREAAEREAQAKAAAEKERTDAEAVRARAAAERERLDREAKAKAEAAEKEAKSTAEKEAQAKAPFRMESLDTDTRIAVGREALRMAFTRAAFTGIIARGEGGTDWLGQGDWPARAVELGRKMLEAYEQDVEARAKAQNGR